MFLDIFSVPNRMSIKFFTIIIHKLDHIKQLEPSHIGYSPNFIQQFIFSQENGCTDSFENFREFVSRHRENLLQFSKESVQPFSRKKRNYLVEFDNDRFSLIPFCLMWSSYSSLIKTLANVFSTIFVLFEIEEYNYAFSQFPGLYEKHVFLSH